MDSESPTPGERRRVTWPDGGQVARQVAILAIVLLAWSGLFWGAMRIPGASSDDRAAAAEARRDARRAAANDPAPAADSTPDEAAEAAPEAPGVDDMDPVAPPATPTPPAPDPAAAVEREPEPVPAVDRAPEPARTDDVDLSEAPPSDVPMEEMMLDPIDEAAAAGEDLGEVSFAADILPILERRCIKCHGGLRDDGTQRLEEGLSLLTVDDILAGSTWGSVVEPGDVAGSYLYELVEEGDMPDNEPRLLPRELRLIAAWIRQGAPSN